MSYKNLVEKTSLSPWSRRDYEIKSTHVCRRHIRTAIWHSEARPVDVYACHRCVCHRSFGFVGNTHTTSNWAASGWWRKDQLGVMMGFLNPCMVFGDTHVRAYTMVYMKIIWAKKGLQKNDKLFFILFKGIYKLFYKLWFLNSIVYRWYFILNNAYWKNVETVFYFKN